MLGHPVSLDCALVAKVRREANELVPESGRRREMADRSHPFGDYG